jgi:serine/threonine protein kinase
MARRVGARYVGAPHARVLPLVGAPLNIVLREQLQMRLGGDFAVEQELTGGGMSRVFVANDIALGRRIVVKVLRPEMAAACSVERFRREIQLAASLLHPHLVPLLSAGEADGLPYYTMPLVDGESLRARLNREQRLPIDDAVRLGREIAEALDYAHRRGVVHRDIKPENILLHDGHALVTDFGIARALSRATGGLALTGVGIALGTPAYMSPEQGTGDVELDGRADVYALGCVLFEMLAGAPPYSGLSAQAIIVRHFTDPVPRLGALRPDVSPAVEQAVTRALAKDRRDRFQTAGELARALDDRVGNGSTTPVALTPTERRTDSQRLVAVLPFENMSADPENEYFVDGITEDIIAQLSKIRGLKVIARSSVMRYKKRHQTVSDIARVLGVAHVVEGSVRRSATRLRIVAQLIDAGEEEQLWTETYDRDISDVFAIQSEVAEHIAETLKTRLSTTDKSRLAKKPTEDMEAYNLYLLGRHHYGKVTGADFAKAIEYYRRTIARDPGFARAYASLAEAQFYLGFGYWGIRPRDAFPEAQVHAARALALDTDSADAHAMLGVFLDFYEFKWEPGGAELDRAVELNPSSAMIRLYRAMHRSAMGDFAGAIADRDVACQLDPSAMSTRGNATWILYLARQMDRAIDEGRTLREMEPGSPYAAFSHGLVCAQGGEPLEAVAAFRDAVQLSNRASLYLTTLAYSLAVAGQHDESRVVLRELSAIAEREFVWPMGLAMAHAHLGDTTLALDYLERAYEERVGWMLLAPREPALDILRAEPRCEALMRKIRPAARLDA